MMHTTMTNATLVATTSLRMTITLQSRVMMEWNRAQAAETAKRDKENYHVDTGKIPKKKEEGRCGPELRISSEEFLK